MDKSKRNERCPFDGYEAEEIGGDLVRCSHGGCCLHRMVVDKSEWNSRSPVSKPSPGAPVDGEAGVDTSGCDHDPQIATVYPDGRLGQIKCSECDALFEPVHAGELKAMRLELTRLRSTPKPEGDGEAGDLEGVEEILNELLADAIPPEARVVRVLNAARRIAARLNPSPKQGRPMKLRATNPEHDRNGDVWRIQVQGDGNPPNYFSSDYKDRLAHIAAAINHFEAGEGGKT